MCDLDQDPRWVRLHTMPWTCRCCGERHAELFDLAFIKPDFWHLSNVGEPNSALTPDSVNILTEDFCIVEGETYFVRGVLNLPILGSDGCTLGLGVWSSLAKRKFITYVETFDDGEQGDLGPWSGRFANSLQGYAQTLNAPCRVLPRDDNLRPCIEIANCSHPLAVEQRDGITFDRVLDLYALNGHDIRPSLLPN